MNTLDGLLRAVLENPADDTLRLVYADALQDADEADRAEFIRMSVEANRSTAPCYHDLTRPPGCPTCALHIRADALAREWTDGEINWERWAGLPSIGWACHNLTGEPRTKLLRTANGFRFRRGFVAEIRLPLAAFVSHANDLFSRHPIEAVVLTDKDPDPIGQRTQWPLWSWVRQHPYSNAPHLVPDDLWQLLAGYDTTPDARVYGRRYASAAAADAAMSAACVAYGRKLAGLPPLE